MSALVATVAVVLLVLVMLRLAPGLRFQLRTLYAMRRRPESEERQPLPVELDEPVTVTFDERGVPRIMAASERDAWRALGYIVARDRLFQMDWLRRRAAGRTAELLGRGAVAHDRMMRPLGLRHAATAIVAQLPACQRQLLGDFALGVNAVIERRTLPFEFAALRYRPEAWTPTDSVQILLGLHLLLSGGIETRWMRWVMQRTLPKAVVDFLLERTLHSPVPIEALRRLADVSVAPSVVDACSGVPAGSNACAVAGSRTRDGCALLANDLHLPLGFPSLLYLAELRFPGAAWLGAVVPGIPLLVAGSNGDLAWGLTNLAGDCMTVEALSAEAVDAVVRIDERIGVRGAEPEQLTVERHPTGPILRFGPRRLPLLLRWSALDPAGVDLGLHALHHATDIEAAVSIARSSGSAPLNILFASADGRVASTVTGRFPRSAAGKTGYLRPDELPPAVISPSCGWVASANERHPLSFDPSAPYRRQSLARGLAVTEVDETALDALMRDLNSPGLERFRELALSTARTVPGLDPRDVRILARWDGRAELNNRAMIWLQTFREEVIQQVLSPLFAACLRLDAGFRFRRNNLDELLFAILEAGGGPWRSEDSGGWHSALGEALIRSADRVRQRYGRLDVPWATVQRPELEHPLATALPLLAPLLRAAARPVPGAPGCLWVTAANEGIVLRLIVAPGRHQRAIALSAPGQSGRPLSAHAWDQLAAWRQGRGERLFGTKPGHRLSLVPLCSDASGKEYQRAQYDSNVRPPAS